MVVTRNGLDVYQVRTSTEAVEVLNALYESSSLSKKELTGIVSLQGLSVHDTVRVFNRFTREGQVNENGTIRHLAA